jgi:hypothetical protein
MGMDFTEERVIHALRASFDNPDQAVELLLNVRPPLILPIPLKVVHGT